MASSRMSGMTTLAMLVAALPMATSFAGVLPGSALLRRALPRPAARNPAPLGIAMPPRPLSVMGLSPLSEVGLVASESAPPSEDITRGRELASRVAAAKKGDTIVLEKVSALQHRQRGFRIRVISWHAAAWERLVIREPWRCDTTRVQQHLFWQSPVETCCFPEASALICRVSRVAPYEHCG